MQRPDRRDLVAFAGLTIGLLAWFAGPGIVRGFVFPVGPDAPVYLWWTRLVGVEGLSAVTRPGVPALALVLSGTLHLPVSAVLAALEIAGGVLTGVTAAALVRMSRSDDRPTWILAGALVGTFSVHVATGYLATLVFGVLFLAALATLAVGTRRGAVAAAILLGAGAIAHPRFLAVGAAILLIAAGLSWRDDRTETRRILGAITGGGLILAVAGLALLVGPSPLLVDTSRDAFLRRVGLDDILHRAYLSRFLARWTRYAPWGALPLVAYALPPRGPRRTVDRILLAWVIVAAGGALFSAVTGLLPIDRFVTFAFAVPILAACGAVRIVRSPRIPRTLAAAIATALSVAMLVGAGGAWLRQEPFLEDRDLAALATANAVASAAPETTLVFPVGSEQSAFLLTLAGNAIRATLPPERIRDAVIVVVGSSPGVEGEAIVRRTALDQEEALAAHGGRAQRILVVPFAERIGLGGPWTLIGDDVAIDPAIAPASSADPVAPYAPWLPLAATLVALASLAAVGWAWSRTLVADVVGAAALAPAIGIGVTILIAFVAERIGVPLRGSVGPTAIAALSLASGPMLVRVAARTRGSSRRGRHRRT